MKKFITITLVLALVLTMFVPALAAGETEAKTNLSFTYSVSEPTYTVTIPGELALDIGYTEMFIEASGVDNLGEKSIYITFEGTQWGYPIDGYLTEGYFALALDDDMNEPRMLYELYNAWGEHMACEVEGYTEYSLLHEGQELAIFGEDGEQIINTYVGAAWLDDLEPNATYYGYIIFGISLR